MGELPNNTDVPADDLEERSRSCGSEPPEAILFGKRVYADEDDLNAAIYKLGIWGACGIGDVRDQIGD